VAEALPGLHTRVSVPAVASRSYQITHGSGVPIAYTVRGEGDGVPVVMVSGYLAGRQMWSLQATRLARSRRVLCYDRRGVGDSGRPADGYGLDENVADLLAVVDALGSGPVDLVGHSMGGFIAQGFALGHPERVRSLALVSSAPYRTSRADFGVGIFVDGNNRPLDWHRGGLERAIELLLPEPGFEWVRLGFRENLPRQQDPEQSIKTFRAFDGVDFRQRLPHIRCPVLVVHGTLDAVVPVEEGVAMAERLPDARVVLLEGVGHLPMLTAPLAVLEALEGHLGRVGEAAGG